MIAMESPKKYPQLQLKDHEDITVVTYYAMILECIASPTYDTSITYATQSVHTKLNLPTTINDPLMQFKIIKNINKPTTIAFKKAIPLKHTFNLNDGSLLTTVKKTGAQPYPNDSSLKDKQFLIKIVCAKNPKLGQNSFAQDRNFAKKQFFKEPSLWIDEKDNAKELIDAQIIKACGTTDIFDSITNKWEIIERFEHGPKSITNDNNLRQSIIDEKIVPIRSPLILIASKDEELVTHKSCFKSLRNRELTGSFGKRY